MPNITLQYQCNDPSIISQDNLYPEINRWIDDKFLNRTGHFEQPLIGPVLKFGTKININNTLYNIINTDFNSGATRNSIILDKGARTGRINKVYDIDVLSDGVANSIVSTIPSDSPPEIFGDGKDGDITISSAVQVNKYYYLTVNISAKSTILTVNSTTGLSIGDEIILIQTQSTNGSQGNYEFCRVLSLTSTSITIVTPLKLAYTTGSYGTAGCQVTQIIRVPNYKNVTITSAGSIVPQSWNYYSGGYVVFRVKETFTNNGLVNVNGNGFHGGGWRSSGEGYYAQSADGRSTGNGGMNGAYVSSGGDGVSGGAGGGGWHASSSDLSRLVMGGGGGSGGGAINGRGQVVAGGAGGNGAGVILIIAKSIINNNTFCAAAWGGGAGGYIYNTYGRAYGGGGGGGGGGAIYLLSPSVKNPGAIYTTNAAGGNGGNGGGNWGGAGGSGISRIDVNSITGNAPYNTSYSTYPFTVHCYNPEPFYINLNIDKSIITNVASIVADFYEYTRFYEYNNHRILMNFNGIDWVYYNGSQWISSSIDQISSSSMSLYTLNSLTSTSLLPMIKDATTSIKIAVKLFSGHYNQFKIKSISLTGTLVNQFPQNIPRPKGINSILQGNIKTLHL